MERVMSDVAHERSAALAPASPGRPAPPTAAGKPAFVAGPSTSTLSSLWAGFSAAWEHPPGSQGQRFSAGVLRTLQQRSRGAEYRPEPGSEEARAMQSISQLRGIWGSAAALGIFPAVSLLVGRIGGSTAALVAAALASQRASAVAEDAVAPWGLANLLEAGHVCYSPLATEAAVIVREMAPAPKERRQEDRSFGFGKAADSVLWERSGAFVAPRVAEAARDKTKGTSSIAAMLAHEAERTRQEAAPPVEGSDRADDMTRALRGGAAVAVARAERRSSTQASNGAFFDTVMQPGFLDHGGNVGQDVLGESVEATDRRGVRQRERDDRRARIAAIRARREAAGIAF